jgi:hypothetical protein
MANHSEMRFACSGLSADGTPGTFTIVAAEVLRPDVRNGMVLGSRLEWQFIVEEFDLVVVRRSRMQYVAADDPHRIFGATGGGQPPFASLDRRPSRQTA